MKGQFQIVKIKGFDLEKQFDAKFVLSCRSLPLDRSVAETLYGGWLTAHPLHAWRDILHACWQKEHVHGISIARSLNLLPAFSTSVHLPRARAIPRGSYGLPG